MTRAVEVAGAYEGIIERFTAWATDEPSIRAAVVIGSRARADHPADEWADLDVVIWSIDRRRYLDGDAWVTELGEPWITFVEAGPDPRVTERRVLFAGGLEVDFAFIDPAVSWAAGDHSASVVGLVFGRGSRVLLDRDGEVTAILATLVPSDAVPSRALPDRAEFNRVTADFWYHAVWTAKHLRRGELWWAKGSCDGHLKGLLLTVLEWEAEARGRDHWFRGRFLEEWADPVTVDGLGRAFARYDEDDIWDALRVTMDLFTRLSRQVATALALPYPVRAEEQARELVRSYAATRQLAL